MSNLKTSPATVIGPGVVGGLLGGIVFGLLMQNWGMIPMVAMLVGSKSVAIGWVVHLVISAVIGAGFAAALGRRAATPVAGAATGLVYGAFWWVLGALILMPAKLGMDVFMFNPMTYRSLAGHLVYGAILGITVGLLARRGAR